MLAHGLLFWPALAVKQDHTPLRSGCETGDETIATLPAGTPVEVRFRLADGSDCFKIAATVNGRAIAGYGPAAALANVEQFELQRTSAASVDVIQALNPLAAPTEAAVARTGDPVLNRAIQ